MAGTGRAYEGRNLHLPPLPPTTAPDEVTRWRIIEDYLSSRPRAELGIVDMTENDGYTGSTPWEIIFGEAREDTSGFWDASNPTRLTIPPGLEGDYLISARIETGGGGDPDTYNVFSITKYAATGGTFVVAQDYEESSGPGFYLTTHIDLLPGDSIGLEWTSIPGGGGNFVWPSDPNIRIRRML